MEEERSEKSRELEQLRMEIEETNLQIQNAMESAKNTQAILDLNNSELQNLKEVLEEKESCLESQIGQLQELREKFERLSTEGQALRDSKEAVLARYV